MRIKDISKADFAAALKDPMKNKVDRVMKTLKDDIADLDLTMTHVRIGDVIGGAGSVRVSFLVPLVHGNPGNDHYNVCSSISNNMREAGEVEELEMLRGDQPMTKAIIWITK